jgi:hypothetical protein
VTLPLSKVREIYRLGQPLSLALLRRTEVAKIEGGSDHDDIRECLRKIFNLTCSDVPSKAAKQANGAVTICQSCDRTVAAAAKSSMANGGSR